MSKLRVCLTGGIASGKTYVSDAFAVKGACVIDTDVIAREVVKVGSSGLSQLVHVFGDKILNNNGGLNRQQLKQVVFKDKKKLTKLNAVMHPLIINEMNSRSKQNKVPVEVCVIPLFDGNPQLGTFDRVLVVDVSQQEQLKRVVKRDGVDTKIASAIMKSQLSRKQRLALATDVLVNNRSLSALDKNIGMVSEFYSQLIAN